MPKKFNTPDELQAVRDRALEIALEGVASFYSDIGSTILGGTFPHLNAPLKIQPRNDLRQIELTRDIKLFLL